MRFGNYPPLRLQKRATGESRSLVAIHVISEAEPPASKRRGKCRLPTVTELFPEIAAPGVKDEDQPSCSAAEALTRQEPFINQNLAYQTLGMLTQLLRHGCVSYHGGFCNLATGQLVPLAVGKPQQNSLR
jgi:hypothetical protein